MEELVERAKNGEKEAYSELINMIKKDMFNKLRYKISEPEDIEDIIQDTIIIGYTKIKQLRDNKRFKTWMMKILNNECNRFYNDKKRKDEINDKYISNSLSIKNENLEEKLEFDNIIKNLNDTDKEIMKLYYEDNLSSEQISKLLGMNTNTIKSKISRGHKKIKDTYKKVLMTILILCLVTTGVVLGRDIIKYLKSIFDLSSIGRNNDGVLSAIETKEWIQNTEMEYIELSPGYKIRIDYLLMDDINMYMVFDLLCEEEQREYNRMSIVDLIIKDEMGNIICNEKDIMENSISKLRGWKGIESNSNNNIRELTYMISDGYPRIKRIDMTLSGIVLYNDKNSNTERKVIKEKEINISLDIDEKFINRNVVEYVQEGIDSEYNVKKAIITDTGFYAVIETNKSNVKFELETNKKEYKCKSRFLKMNYNGEIKYYHLILSDIKLDEKQTELILQSEDKVIKLKNEIIRSHFLCVPTIRSHMHSYSIRTITFKHNTSIT